MRNVFTKTLWDARRSVLVWALTIGAVGAIYAAFWPIFNTPSMMAMVKSYPAALLEAMGYTNMTNAAGYVGATIYGLFGPLLVAVLAISHGARSIAGDEELGTLDLLLAHPVSRIQVAVQRFAALVAELAVVAVVLWATMLLVAGPVRLTGISPGEFAAMTLQLALFGVLLAALSFAVGAATGRRALALGTGTAVAVLSYLANGVFPQLAALTWTRGVSPWRWFVAGEPLRHGLQVGNCALLLVTTLVVLAIGTWVFDRRDIAV